MNSIKKHSLLLICFFSFCSLQAQELNFDVKVNAPNLQTTDPRVFSDLEASINEFINNTRWTDDDFEDHEKIEGSINITIAEELTTTTFKADFFVQSLRPVFNSNYTTQLLNYVDKDVPFDYTERQPIRRSEDQFYDNLSSVLTFYVMMILAYDYDSYAPQGGEIYFEKANAVVNSIPQSVAQVDKTWSNEKGRGKRFQMVADLLSPRVKPFRQSVYEFHRLALDAMANDADKSRAIMTSSLTTLASVEKDYPNSIVMQMFTDSKNSEIIEIYKDAPRGEQSKIYDIMIKLDPARANIYNAIR